MSVPVAARAIAGAESMSQVSSKISLQWLQPSVLLPMATAAGHASTLASSHILLASVKTRIASYPDLPTDSLMAVLVATRGLSSFQSRACTVAGPMLWPLTNR